MASFKSWMLGAVATVVTFASTSCNKGDNPGGNTNVTPQKKSLEVTSPVNSFAFGISTHNLTSSWAENSVEKNTNKLFDVNTSNVGGIDATMTLPSSSTMLDGAHFSAEQPAMTDYVAVDAPRDMDVTIQVNGIGDPPTSDEVMAQGSIITKHIKQGSRMMYQIDPAKKVAYLANESSFITDMKPVLDQNQVRNVNQTVTPK